MPLRSIRHSIAIFSCLLGLLLAACANGTTSTGSTLGSSTPTATLGDTPTVTSSDSTTPTPGATPTPVSTAVPGAPAATATPIPMRNALYFKAANALLLLNADTGAFVWKQDLIGGNISNPAPVIANGLAYYVGYDGYMQARDAHSGAPVWKSQAPPYYGPTVTSQAVYLNGPLGVFALNAHTGAQLWNKIFKDAEGTPFLWNNQLWVGPQIVSSTSIAFTALDPATGQTLRTITLNNLTFPGFSSNVPDGRVFFSCNDNVALCAVDLNTGTLLWQLSTANIYSTPILANGTLFVPTTKAMLALDPATGHQRFAFATANTLRYAPIVSNGVAYFNDDYTYYAINASNGARLWTSPHVGIYSSGVLVNGKIILPGMHVVALNATNGQVLWTYTPRGSTSLLAAAPW